MKRKTIAVIFGGQSSEHEISCISAATIIDCINPEYYRTVLIGITKEGHWLKVNSVEEIRSGEWVRGVAEAVISPDATKKHIVVTDQGNVSYLSVDVVFPALHGLYGEDGTIQGILELAKIPYVGCGVLASAISMDKIHTKLVAETLGIRQAAFVPVASRELKALDTVVAKIEEALEYPVFVKPSNAGSSRGVSKAADRDTLIEGLLEAAKHDKKILVEETITGREIECAVLGGEDAHASGIGEIVAAAAFYDYDAKYNNTESKVILDPDVPKETVEEIRETALRIFKAVDGFGLSRVDFFIKSDTGEVVFNEINTFPGFTDISMYPMLWENMGMSKPQLVEKLIQTAFARCGE